MKGFYNKMLDIDLTTRRFQVKEISDEILSFTLGGRGLGSYLLWENLKERIDPLSPENVLIFTVGPATGTKMVGASRFGVYSKSPLTNFYADSYSGGYVAPQIKKCGYDAIIIRGASDSPVYLEISDTGVEFRKAEHLWGKDTYETESSVLSEVNVNGAQAIVIGPAGENLVRFACIENNYWRSAGRCGMGAIMGSKKLKAIVFHGRKNCEIADEELMDSYVREFIKKARNNAGVRNYQKYDNWENISAEHLISNCKVKPKACYRCLLACGNLTEITKGKHKGLKIEGPEYETIYAFGGLCKIGDIGEIAYLNDLCDRLGMDTISAGNLISFCMELSRRGKIQEKIEYGNPEKVQDLLWKIARREGIGDILAEGIKYASKTWRSEDIAIHVKGLEPAGYDPRVLKGMALGYATSPRGACHLTATFYKAELSGIIDPETVRGKAKLFIDYEDRLTIFDTLILCRFLRDVVQWDDLTVILKATTGLSYKKEQLKEIAEDITTLRRLFNIREGLTKEDDLLPERMFKEARKDDGKVLRKEEFLFMLNDYYKLRNWDTEGKPRKLPRFLKDEVKLS